MILTEIFAALRWWLVLLLLGFIALPLTFTLFKKLPDRGYAFTKMIGLLLVGYCYWFFGSLGFLTNNSGSMLVSAAIVGGFAFWLYRRDRRIDPLTVTSGATGEGEPAIIDWLKQNRIEVFVTECIFAILFIMWVWVRSQNPAIAATEKPMEFAFLNAIGRSPTFPPIDPWLSGFAISYYYFGYVMTSLIARLANVPEQIAFNLAVAWLFASTGTGGFGLVYNLLRTQGAKYSARILGIVAALAIPLAGNMTIALEIAHANDVGSPEFWEWLDVRDLNQAPTPESTPRYESGSWWWWRSSRPIREYHLNGSPEDGLEPIAEFPAFSFILGDLHAHVLALPFAFLSLAVAMVWWLNREPSASDRSVSLNEWERESWTERLQILLRFIGLPLWIFSALLLGGLAFLNTWDVLIHLFVILGAFLLARWRDGGWRPHLIVQTAIVAGLLLIPAVLLYLPFFIGFRSQAGAPYLLPMMMRPTRLVQFLIIFFMPLWAITILLIALVARQRFRFWPSGLITAVGLITGLFLLAMLFSFIVAASADGAPLVLSLAGDLGLTLSERPDQVLAPGWALAAISAVLPSYFKARLSYPALTLLLATITGMVIMIWRERLRKVATPAALENELKQNGQDVLPFVLLLIMTAALLTIGPEFIFLRDNFSARMNTIFKFYYQAWVMFGVSALYAIGYLWLASRNSSRIVPVIATTGYVLALAVALLFPVYSINSRSIEYRGPITVAERQPATLDGLAQIGRFSPGDYAAVLWLRENVTGTPVILEAVGGQYTGYGRISAGSGLPTLLGWAGHEYQWRGDTPEPAIREPVVRDIYSTPDIQSIEDLLNQYDVRYIVVSGLERDTYGLSGMDKFTDNLEVAFENSGATIYHWQPE